MGIQWHESLTIGIKDIDNQHKELISRFDQLLKACEKEKGVTELKRLLDFLDEYAVKHFSDEEALQRKHNYPGYEAHRREHESFVVNLRKMRAEIDREGAGVYHVIETNNMLIKWLIEHISSSDGAIGIFIKADKS